MWCPTVAARSTGEQATARRSTATGERELELHATGRPYSAGAHVLHAAQARVQHLAAAAEHHRIGAHGDGHHRLQDQTVRPPAGLLAGHPEPMAEPVLEHPIL